MQNFFSNVAPGGGPQGQAPTDGAPWWMKYLGRGAGIVGGVGAIFFGIWSCITISPLCLVAGIWQILAGFIVLVIEAPFCCFFLDFVQQISEMVDGRPVWQKALLYLIFSIPALMFCVSLTTILGSGGLFAIGVINGVMSLGKKASLDEMRSNAFTPTAQSPGDNMKSNLVGNIHGQDVEAARQAS